MEQSSETVQCTGKKDVCERCNGTGLVCGYVPVIGPGSCCVDYANALCPDCRGSGVRTTADVAANEQRTSDMDGEVTG